MKPRILGLVVVVLALSLSAYTTHVETKTDATFGTYYWFQLDALGVPQTMPNLIYQGSDPYWCSFIGLGYFCVGAYTAYTQDEYGYHAAGYLVTRHKHVL